MFVKTGGQLDGGVGVVFGFVLVGLTGIGIWILGVARMSITIVGGGAVAGVVSARMAAVINGRFAIVGVIVRIIFIISVVRSRIGFIIIRTRVFARELGGIGDRIIELDGFGIWCWG